MDAKLIFGLLLCGFAFTAVGMILGAFVVYRTKRESHEPFLGIGQQPAGTAFNLDENAPIAIDDFFRKKGSSDAANDPSLDVIRSSSARFEQAFNQKRAEAEEAANSSSSNIRGTK